MPVISFEWFGTMGWRGGVEHDSEMPYSWLPSAAGGTLPVASTPQVDQIPLCSSIAASGSFFDQGLVGTSPCSVLGTSSTVDETSRTMSEGGKKKEKARPFTTEEVMTLLEIWRDEEI